MWNLLELEALPCITALISECIGDRERRALLVLGEQYMPKSLIADHGFVKNERPPCPTCHGPMMFAGLVPGQDGVAIPTFECTLCSCAEKAA